MTFKTLLSNFVSQLSPLSLVKQIYPGSMKSADLLHPQQDNKPWLDADQIELTQDDFAC